MVNLTYVGQTKKYEVEFSRISEHVVQVLGELPASDSGFVLSRIDRNDGWDHTGYTTLYRELEDGLQFSDDGSVYVTMPEPELPQEPEPYVPTLEEVKEAKVLEMEMVQQDIVQAGVEVVLTDGTTEHFDLTEKEQKQLAVLQGVIASGDEKIPWHTSDETEHCKYYSSADMSKVVKAAFDLATYHETYFRDLRIYIRSLATKEAVESITYGIEIPEKYRSQPLVDMLAGAS